MATQEGDWHVVESRANSTDSANNKKIVDMAQRHYEDAGKKASFVVFSKSLLDMARPRDAFRLYYFSPDASKECAGPLGSMRAAKCPKPSTVTEEGEPRLKLAVGDSQTAWDLLK